MRQYIWMRPEWPDFSYDPRPVLTAVDSARRAQFYFLGEADALPQNERERRLIDAAAESAMDTSAIEGERLDYDDVRSSVARRLHVAGGTYTNDRTEGVVAVTLDAVRNFEAPLTEERLFAWHADLFPLEAGEKPRITVARWRQPEHDPMQIVSGPIGRTRTHFEAPPASHVAEHMQRFFEWFRDKRERENGLIRAAIAHLWFLTIHPFEDGNGRIGRAIADLAISQDERSGERLYSLSRQISVERSAYYAELERAQSGSLDVTAWVVWFLGCFERALAAARGATERARRAARFWQRYPSASFNDRQQKVLYCLLGGFEGGLNLRKYIALTKAPRATAQRDLHDLVNAGVLRQIGAGRATHYDLADHSDPRV